MECAARTVFAVRLFALGLIGLALMPARAPAATAPEPSSALKAEIESSYGKLPFSFEANRGQTDSQVKFLARGRGYTLLLTSTEAVLSLAKPQAHAETSATSSPEAGRTVLAMQLSGANPEPQVTGKDALPGRVNYLRGKDPAHWQTQIPTYARVAYEGIYPGVDLIYYGNQGQLEYDFVVAPGADPGVLKLVFRAPSGSRSTPQGTWCCPPRAATSACTPPSSTRRWRACAPPSPAAMCSMKPKR